MGIQEFAALRVLVESDTGFKTFQTMPDQQSVWYGKSENFEDFAELVSKKVTTGSIVYLMDTSSAKIYDFDSDAWFDV